MSSKLDKVSAAAEKAREAVEARDQAIRDAHSGARNQRPSMRAIAEAAGMSHQRVHQIVNDKSPRA